MKHIKEIRNIAKNIRNIFCDLKTLLMYITEKSLY